MKLNQIFTIEQYNEAYRFISENGYTIKEIEAIDDVRQFQIVEMPQPSLEKVRAVKIAELKNERNSREEAPVEYGGKLWDFDTKARDRITAAATALEVSDIETIIWTAYDDTSSALTANDLKGIIATAAMRGNELHEQYRILRDEVNAATSKEEVDAISWE